MIIIVKLFSLEEIEKEMQYLKNKYSNVIDKVIKTVHAI